MSHYAVAVFADDGDFDRLLRPYDVKDRDYFEFVAVEYADIASRFERFHQHNPLWSFAEFINQFGYVRENGQWGYYCNKQGYWDWYSLDGRDYMFSLKDGVKLSDGAFDYHKNDYDWLAEDEAAAEDAAEFWDDFIGETKLAEPPGIWDRNYFIKRYKNKERYVEEMRRTIPYAFITPDGVWHSAGRVGSFASSNETVEDADQYIQEWDNWIASDANPYVNLVDCHI